MSMNRTKEEQYVYDRELAYTYGINRDTPGGHAGKALRRAQDSVSWSVPKWTPSTTTDEPYSWQSFSENPKKESSMGSWIVAIIILIVIL